MRSFKSFAAVPVDQELTVVLSECEYGRRGINKDA